MTPRTEPWTARARARSARLTQWIVLAAAAWIASPALAQDTLVVENNNVGINTSSPISDLTVKGDGAQHYFTILRPNNSLAFEVQVSGNNVITADAPGYYWFETDEGFQSWGTMAAAGEYRVRDHTASTYPFRIQAGTPTDTMFLASSGRTGLGTTFPAARLEVENLAVEGAVIRLQDSNATCDLDPDPGQLTITCPSDARLKKNLRTAPTARILRDLVAIDLFEYEVVSTDETALGPVAQRLRATHPDRVGESDDGTLMVSLPSPSELVGAIQELNRLVTVQSEAMRQQRELITKLEARLAELEGARDR